MEKLIRAYCETAVRSGINIGKGQTLVITCPVECAYVARMLTEEAYKAGAGEVIMRWVDEKISRETFLHADISKLEKYPEWEKMKMDRLSAEGAAFMSISSADPEINKGVESAKLKAWAKAVSEGLKVYRKRTMANENQWCVISVPSDAWAKKVFPNEPTVEKAKEKLWESILFSSRIKETGSAENWKKHQDLLAERAEKLNELNFDYLHYTNSLGTDLKVTLPENHVWMGGSDVSKSGVVFSPNIPTEELFTAPKRDGVDGVVYSSKPLVYNGNLIEDFAVWFKKGKVTKFTAKRNEETLGELINGFKNADYLGEVALVPFDSPISQSGILFYNTLYDENASCHFAFGAAYPECVKDTHGLSDRELTKLGLNCSDAHSDFMIGTADLSIVGYKKDGTSVKVFENGNFAL